VPSPTPPLTGSPVFDEAARACPRLDGRTVAITGCTSGTGRVMAQTCAALDHLSHFLLTSLARPLLRSAAGARGDARVVNHSSGARRGPALQATYLGPNGGHLGGDGFPGAGKWRRHQQSKLANLLFTYTLDDRVPASDVRAGIKIVCAHPGPTDSGLQSKTAAAGGTRLLDRLILKQTPKVAHSVEDGSLGNLTASIAPAVASADFYGPAGRRKPGPAVLLPPERDRSWEQLLFDVSLASTGISEFFRAEG
jgi:NAD(P)-dependent dehydrogenase (short-subunit alcohol dehydrogenase family)